MQFYLSQEDTETDFPPLLALHFYTSGMLCLDI